MVNTIEKENNLISTSELANQLNTTKDVILAVVKKCLPNKEIKHGKATYFNEIETTLIIDHMKNNVSNNRSVELNSTVSTTTTNKENQLKMYKISEDTKAMKIEDRIQLSFKLQADIIKDLNECNVNLTKEINELTDWKTEKLYIENEQYKSKELKTKINRLIRQIAIERFNKDFKGTWNYYLNLYCNIHCFKGGQTIEMITDRGDLREFYNLILNY